MILTTKGKIKVIVKELQGNKNQLLLVIQKVSN